MSLLELPKPEVPRPQPNFPDEDLHRDNVAYAEKLLRTRHEAQSQADTLTVKHLGQALHMAHHALSLSGSNVELSNKNFDAMRQGFADFELMSFAVHPRIIRQQLMIKNMHSFLTRTGTMVELDLAEKIDEWSYHYPNIYGVITEPSFRKNETLGEMRMRTVGARLAHELQKAA